MSWCGRMSWDGRDWRNGALLDAAENAGFDLLLTCDQNVRYQQNLTSRKLALLILSSNHWPTLRRVAARIATAVDFMQAGQVVTVDIATSVGPAWQFRAGILQRSESRSARITPSSNTAFPCATA
jgi:hypothetical protein